MITFEQHLDATEPGWRAKLTWQVLGERRAAWDAGCEAARKAFEPPLRAILAEPYGCPFCDSGKLRTEGNPAKDHDPTCGFAMARAALAEGAAP